MPSTNKVGPGFCFLVMILLAHSMVRLTAPGQEKQAGHDHAGPLEGRQVQALVRAATRPGTVDAQNAIMTWAVRRQDRRSPLSRGSRGPCISPANCRTERLVVRAARQSSDNPARRTSLFPGPYNAAMRKLLQPRVTAAHAGQAHQPRRCARAAVAWLEIFTAGSANQPLEDAHDPPGASPVTLAVRAKRALRSAPVVLVRGVRMPAYAKTDASIIS